MRARRLIGEQQLHVTLAHRAAIDTIIGTAATLNGAGDMDIVGTVEFSSCGASGVVELKRDFGQIARGTRGRAGENHIVHFRAAHAARRIFAHYPAQSFDEIGLTAAVGADHTGQSGRDIEVGRLNERFKTVQAETGELQS